MTRPLEPDLEALIIEQTRAWVDRVVIGLTLCPFAKAVQVKEQVRYVVSPATTPQELIQALAAELQGLNEADPELVDTTLLIHPYVLESFFDYNDFLSKADELLAELGLEGQLQIASFHPEYCFADARSDDPANYTNRSPFPMLHLLREASVARAVEAYPDASRIYERNIDTLRALGPEALARLLRG
jgi:uncharacterized protein